MSGFRSGGSSIGRARKILQSLFGTAYLILTVRFSKELLLLVRERSLVRVQSPCRTVEKLMIRCSSVGRALKFLFATFGAVNYF